MLPFILPRIPQHEVYTETFLGGGAVFWAKRPAPNETINDKDDVVVNFYEVFKLKFDRLKPLIDASLVSRVHHTRALKILRAHQKGIKTDRIELAWSFWYLTNLSHSCKIGGGLKYSNKQHTRTVDVLRTKKSEFTEMLVMRIEKTTIENKDAVWLLHSRNVRDAFHYLDPPYPGADQGHYRGYTWEEYEKLLIALESIKGQWMLSNYHSPLLQEYIEKNNWTIEQFEKPLLAAVRENNGKRKTEVLVRNYANVCNTIQIDFPTQNHITDETENYSHADLQKPQQKPKKQVAVQNRSIKRKKANPVE